MAPYSYSWTPSAGLNDPNIAQPTATPTATTTYQLTVTDAVGQHAADSVTLTLAPPVAAEAGPDCTIAAGQTANLQGAAFGGVRPYSYNWSPATGLDNPTLLKPDASPTNTTTYTLTVTDALGQTANDSVTITVAPPVVAEAGPDKVIAAGRSVTLQGSASGGLAPYTYAWTHTAGLNDVTIAQPSAAPAATATYILTVTDALGQSSFDTVTVTVIAPPTAEAGPNKIIAGGHSTLLEGSVTGGLGPFSYSWSPATNLSSTTTAQPTASPLVTTTYTLTATDSLGETCHDTMTVTVAPPVVAEAGADKAIVSGGATALVGSTAGGLAPYSYSWTPTAGLNDPHIAQPIASPAATTTYQLAVTDALGQTAADTATVTVVLPVVAEAGPDKVIAGGQSTTLAGAVSGGLGPVIYSWTPTDGLSDSHVVQPTASPTITTTYTLVVTDALGQTHSDSITVTVAPPVVAEAGSGTTIARGRAATLRGSCSGGYGPFTYSWTPTTGLTDPTLAQPIASPAATTTYTLLVTDALGQTCQDTATITVAPLLVAAAGPDKSIQYKSSTLLQGSASGGLAPYTYSWSPATALNNSRIARPTTAPTVPVTVYTLTITDALGQSASDTVTVRVPNAPRTLQVSATPISAVPIKLSRVDLNRRQSGSTSFSRLYTYNTKITASISYSRITVARVRYNFERWIVDGVAMPLRKPSVTFIMSTDHQIVAKYSPAPATYR